MRKLIHITFIIALFSYITESNAQSTLMYYWHFNGLSTPGINYGRDLLINSDSTTPAITTPGTVTWNLQTGTPVGDTINIADNVAGDLINARGSALTTPAADNWGLRPRNPSQYGQLLFAISTTNFQNIVVKFECEASSAASGILNQLFDYSTDGGATYSSTGIVVTTAPAKEAAEDTVGIVWGLVAVDLSAATGINNMSNVIFRIRYTGPNAVQSKTSGNDRFDNVTVEGSAYVPPAKDLLYYWNFDKLTTAGQDYSLSPVNSDSTTTAITTPGTMTWGLQAGAPNGSPIGIMDNNPGDLINARGSALKTAAANNWSIRPRNPSMYAQLLFNISTSNYKDIVVKFEAEASSLYPSTGVGTQLFDYSTDGGSTYSSTGIVVTSPAASPAPLANEDSLTAAWGLVTVDLTAATAVNNISNLIFRVRYTGVNASNVAGSKGNDRIDNFTVEGTFHAVTTATTHASSALEAGYSIYPNPGSESTIHLTAPTTGVKNVSFYNSTGQSLFSTSVSGSTSDLNTSVLESGIYFIIVSDNNTNYCLKFIKN